EGAPGPERPGHPQRPGDPSRRAGRALLQIPRPRRPVGEHDRLAGRAGVGPRHVGGARRGAAGSGDGPGARPADRRRLRAPFPAPQPGGGPRADGGADPRARRAAAAAARAHQADPWVEAPPAGCQVAALRRQAAAGPGRPRV
ncbi:MAG: Hypothetical protein YaeJ with similarity to translation release factor, partial [uncultured Nocardioides sp.]